MAIIDEDGEPTAAEHRARPWWFVPALVGIALGGLVGAALVPAPTSTSTRVVVSADQPHQAVRPSPASPTLATRPSDLPLLPQEQDVMRAMSAIGVTATSVGYSHFDRALGPALPARVIDLGGRSGADVLFVDEVHDVHVCATANPQGLVYRITVDGHETSSIDGVRPIAFLYGDGLFVIAWDGRAESMFELALNVTRAPC